jgi:hypothetical protein
MPVNVTGVKEIVRAMKNVDPELNKQMQKTIRDAMIPIRDKARGYLPSNSDVLSGWARINVTPEQKYRAFPFYDETIASNGVYFSSGQSKRNSAGFSFTHFVANKSASGAIFETSGRKNPGGSSRSRSINPDAGVNFIQSAQQQSPLTGSGKERGRAIYRAWAEDQGKVYPAVIRAVETTAIKFNSGQLSRAA